MTLSDMVSNFNLTILKVPTEGDSKPLSQSAPKWRATNQGPMIKHPEQVLDGNVKGMYMESPNDHKQWAMAKKACQAKWKKDQAEHNETGIVPAPSFWR